jgi:hypothetical protein
MIELRKDGVVADREDVERLSSQFEKTHWVLLRDLLDPELLSLALSYIEQGQWLENRVLGFYYDLEVGPALQLLHFMSNTPKFLETISEITGCNSLSWFDCRLWKMAPNLGHTDEWHSDATEGRLIAMSLNLSPRGYQGGLLQIREAKSHRMLAEIANTGLGDAILFLVSKAFEHRVNEVPNGEATIAFAR